LLALSLRQPVRPFDVAEVALLEDGSGPRLHVGQDLAQHRAARKARKPLDHLARSRRSGQSLVDRVGQQRDRITLTAVGRRLQECVVELGTGRPAVGLHPRGSVGHPLDGDARRPTPAGDG